MELFNDLNVGWRHLLWAETSGHKDYPFKRLQDISTPEIFNPKVQPKGSTPDFSTMKSSASVFWNQPEEIYQKITKSALSVV